MNTNTPLRILAALSACVCPVITQAVPVVQSFTGGDLQVYTESINAVTVPPELREFAPAFEAGQTVTGYIAYDTDQPDFNPGSDGLYRVGEIYIEIPELGLTARRASTFMQISPFDNTPNPDDQFFAYDNGIDSFSSDVGLPDPVSISVLLFGDTSMLADDLLPTEPLNWIFGNLSFDFIASDGSRRQVLMTFRPMAGPDMQVVVDIKPDSLTNPLPAQSKGVLPVAIVGSADLDVTRIDPATIRLALVEPLRWSIEDSCTMNTLGASMTGEPVQHAQRPNGYMDLVLKFDNQAIVEAIESIEGPLSDGDEFILTLTGNLLPAYGATVIQGEDAVRILMK